MIAAAAQSPSAFWYLTRGTAFASLVLLTLAVAGGVLTAVRFRAGGWPRFVVQALHRNVSLLAVVFVAVHVVTAVLDPFAKLGLKDAVVPLASSYRPLWLGLGVVAMELLVALVVTSLARHRLGFRAWRSVHWLAYASWPIALVHGLGTGTDARAGWSLLLVVACVVMVGGAVVWRVSEGWPRAAGVRAAGLAVACASMVVIAGWAANGPLRSGWARIAGTPASLLAQTQSQAAATATATPSPQVQALAAGLRDAVSGSIAQQSDGGLRLDLTDSSDPTLRLLLTVSAGDEAVLTVSRGDTRVCSSAASVNDGVSAICGRTLVQLQLDRSGSASVSGELVTRSAS